jgi:hypothetical protein
MPRELFNGYPDTIDHWPVTFDEYDSIIPGETRESEILKVTPQDDGMIISKDDINPPGSTPRITICKTYSDDNCQRCKKATKECPIKAKLAQ